MKKTLFIAISSILIFLPNARSSASGVLSLSQNNVTLSPGQTTTVTAYPPAGQIANVTSITNSTGVSATVGNNVITINALNSGVSGISQISVCTFDSTCGTINVTVASGFNNNCYNCNNYNNYGQLTFSQNNISLGANQTMTVSVFNTNSGSIYISSNSNPGIVSAFVSGSVINLSGLSYGSSTVTVCGSFGQCGYLYVTVSSSSGGLLSISPSSLNLAINQTSTVYVSGTNNGSVYISNNTNSNIVTANIIGSAINLTGINFGSATLTVCASNSQCASLYVSVNTGNNNSGLLSFSQNNINLTISQTMSVSVYNTNFSSIYISSNSNSGVVTAYVSGSSINLTGINNGSSTITVCSSNAACNYLYVTVGGYNNNNGQISLSPSYVNMNIGDYSNVTVYSTNATNLYISSNSNPSAVSAVVSGNLMSLHALNSGSSVISVCSYNFGQCANLSVTVGGSGFNNFSNITFSQNSVALNTGQSMTVSIYSGNSYTNANSYYISSNSNYSAALATVNGNSLFLTGQNTGTSTINVCQTGNGCGTITVTVNSTYPNGTGAVLGSNVYNNGTLINDNGTIYITYKNTKSAFATATAFTGMGFSFGNTINASTVNLNYSGYTIGSPFIAHPWGSWLKNGQTVYFADSTGLIPIASMNDFTANGGSLNMVVNANSYDLARPIQPVMTPSDPRLR
ncbi:MAG: hypothetical protein ABI643_02825 [Candidatus Doudnabacteria bacterium]